MELNDLLKQLGESVGIPELHADENGYCCISLDDMVINIESREDRLTFYSPIAVVPVQENMIEFYRAILGANYMFSGTNHATLSLENDTNMIMLAQSEFLDALNWERFSDILENFANTLETWKGLSEKYQNITDEESGAEVQETQEKAPQQMFFSNNIRA